jgi:protein subunit release factor A
MSEDDYTVTITADRPAGGMWHNGPNPCWVTVFHNPTVIMARCYGERQYQTRVMALQCVRVMLAGMNEPPRFKERLDSKA